MSRSPARGTSPRSADADFYRMSSADDTRPRSVLVIDDDPAIRCLLQDVLEMEGFGVRTAQDGCAGLAQIRRTAPRLRGPGPHDARPGRPRRPTRDPRLRRRGSAAGGHADGRQPAWSSWRSARSSSRGCCSAAAGHNARPPRSSARPPSWPADAVDAAGHRVLGAAGGHMVPEPRPRSVQRAAGGTRPG